MKEIDCRGMACPSPVLQTRAAVEHEGVTAVQVVVDNASAQQNVQRYLESRGYRTTLDVAGSEYRITGEASTAARAHPDPRPAPAHRPSESDRQKIMVLCASDRIGSGDDLLGRKLMVNFIKTLKEMGPDLWRLVFVNNGVKLAIDGAPALEELQVYEKEGLEILVCGTCLDHFALLDRKKVGTTTNMLDIVTAMQLADKVISL
jgi:selenium metabolism protein YedF